jgi:hypothetical protein
MSKKIAQTYQHRLFNDDELKLPEHDKIVRWTDIAIRENAGFFLDRVGYQTVRNSEGETCVWGEKLYGSIGWSYFDYEQSAGATTARDLVRDLVRKQIPPIPPPAAVKVDRVSWEENLRNERGTVMGAIDLMAWLKLPTVHLEFEIDQARVQWEAMKGLDRPADAGDGPYRIPAKNLRLAESDFVTKFAATDMHSDRSIVVYGSQLFSVHDVRWVFDGHEHQYMSLVFAVEAKSAIPAVGELMRQMNFYRGHVRGAKLFVVAPAEAWPADAQTILREQGIEPINYQANFS